MFTGVDSAVETFAAWYNSDMLPLSLAKCHPMQATPMGNLKTAQALPLEELRV